MRYLSADDRQRLRYKVFTLARVDDIYLQQVLDENLAQGWVLFEVVTNTFSEMGAVRSTTTLIFVYFERKEA